MMLLSLLFCALLISSVKSDDKKSVYSECNQTISQQQFFLESEGYPKGYSANLDCVYNLKGHAMCNTEFYFQFLDFDLEYSANCWKDRLEIIGNEKLCGTLTGVRMYKAIGNYLQLKFVSDSAKLRKGFKLLVTRLPCEGNNHLNSSLRSKNVNTNFNLPNCCANSYNSRRFYLASPGFPYSNQAASDCTYQVYRANPNICRLRIHFNYFSLGMKQGMSCNGGFLEIDGKQICGCQTELDVISQFDQYWGDQPKIIRYKNVGYIWNNNYYYNNQFSGFAIEVVQDECPTRYSPSMETDFNSGNNTRGEKVPEFYFYNDQLNRISWPNKTKPNAEYLNDDSDVKDKRAPKVKIDYYFFDAPEYDDPIPEQKYKEPRSYFETTSTDFLASNGNDVTKCYSWGIYQWNQLTNGVLWQKMPQCKIVPESTKKCEDIRNYYGFLRNPGYPVHYYNNLNCCYRFHKINGYCSIRFYVHDFDLEYSRNCYKDAFVLYNTNKYCGNILRNMQFTFDLTYTQYEDIQFITDSCFCGKGFNIQYEHLPCVATTPPSHTPSPPPMTTPAPTPTPTPSRPPICGGEIFLKEFNISFPNSFVECTYTIHRADEVCGVTVNFTNVNLQCGLEYLSLQNEQTCGNLSGQTARLDFDLDNRVVVHYQRRVDQSPALSSIILKGRQLDCSIPGASRIRKKE